MSAKKKLEEDFFTCIICQEVFKDPVTLHCTHNFCANCLTSFTKTQPDAVAQGCLPCPSCRRLTKVPDPTRPVEEWTSQLKTGFFVKGLMEAIETMDTATKGEEHCSVCRSDGRKTPALVWCIECNAAMCESCQTKHSSTHTVNDIREGRKDCGTSKRKCAVHPEKDVELYCEDCSLVICVLCCSLIHRKCNSVITIEAAGKMVKSKLTEKQEEVKTVIKAMRATSEEKRRQCDKLTLAFTNADEEIDKVSQSVMDQVLSKAKSLKDEVSVLREKHCGGLLGLIKSLEIEIENHEKDGTSIETALQSASQLEIVELFKRLSTTKTHKPAEKHEEVNIKFESFGQKMIEAIEAVDIGRLYIDSKVFNGVDMRRARLQLKDEIDIEIPEDEEEPFLRDVLATSLPDTDVIVVADSANRCVKSFYGKSEHSCLPLPSGPCKMTKCGPTEGAVTLSGKSVLVFSFTPSLKRTLLFSTKKKYYGIAWLGNSTFAMGGLSPVCIDIIDMSGTILKSLSNFVQENLVFYDFQTPVFLCPTPTGDIVVSDYSTRHVTVLNKNLEIEHRFPRIMPQEEGTLRNPLGVACSSNGDIFVVDRSREIVIQLTNEAQLVRNVITPKDGLEGETCIFVDERDHLFLAVANRRVKRFSFVA